MTDTPAVTDGTTKAMPRRVAAPDPYGPELVIGVARAVGTPDKDLHRALAGDLLDYGYTTERIRLSEILSDVAIEAGRRAPSQPEDERIGRLMDEGDRLCQENKSAAAVALLAVADIRRMRLEYHSKNKEQDDRYANEAIPRFAYVIDSVKRPAEVTQLRQIYGDHFILVGLQASPDTRIKKLAEKIKPQRGASRKPDEIADIVSKLIDRDLTETGEYGQNILKTFPMSDVFINIDGDVNKQVARLLDLLFGNPDYPVPTPEEFGMHLAYISSTRSPELGLKVGAAIVEDGGTLISLGVNTHPTPTGTPAYDASAVDIRDLVIDTLTRLPDSALKDDIRKRLLEDADGYARELLSGPLSSARIRDLTEFQPTVHAEMAALLDAVRRGSQVAGATVHVTAYPCHNCAKHLVALGLKVKYLEPYPKSRAAAMYGPDVTANFLPFTGVAPRRYQQLFNVTEDRKNPDGSMRSWSTRAKKVVQPKVDLVLDQQGITDREVSALSALQTHNSATIAAAPAALDGEEC